MSKKHFLTLPEAEKYELACALLEELQAFAGAKRPSKPKSDTNPQPPNLNTSKELKT